MRFPSRAVLAAALSLAVPAHPMGDNGVPEHSIGIDEWKDGWSMMSGAGFSRSRYITDDEQLEQSGLGPVISTSVGFCGSTSCLEFGSQVSFNFYDRINTVSNAGDTVNLDAWMWETALYVSLRSKIPGVPEMGNFNPWIKFMGGYGASVGFPSKIRTAGYDSLANRRLQDEGPLFGMSLMNIFGQKSPGRIWFVEGTMLLQLHWNSWLVKSGGLLPEVQSVSHSSGNPYSLILNLTVGIRAF